MVKWTEAIRDRFQRVGSSVRIQQFQSVNWTDWNAFRCEWNGATVDSIPFGVGLMSRIFFFVAVSEYANSVDTVELKERERERERKSKKLAEKRINKWEVKKRKWSFETLVSFPLTISNDRYIVEDLARLHLTCN